MAGVKGPSDFGLNLTKDDTESYHPLARRISRIGHCSWDCRCAGVGADFDLLGPGLVSFSHDEKLSDKHVPVGDPSHSRGRSVTSVHGPQCPCLPRDYDHLGDLKNGLGFQSVVRGDPT